MTKRWPIGLAVLVARAASAADTDGAAIADGLRELAAAEPTVRDAAVVRLMGLRADQLPLLREAVAAARPLRASQVDALPGIVTYVATRGVMLRIAAGPESFLGVRWPPTVPLDDPDSQSEDGVPLLSFVPGFVAARYFQEGDVLLGFQIGSETSWIHSRSELTWYVRKCTPGTPVSVLIRRGGRPLTVSLRLDARPRGNGKTEREQLDATSRQLSDAEAEAAQAVANELAKLKAAIDQR